MMSPLRALKREIWRSLPLLSLLALVSGGANAVVILAVTAALAQGDIAVLLDRFVFACAAYIWTRRAVEKRLLCLVSKAIYETRVGLLNHLLFTPCDEFERMDRSAVYTAICEDTTTLGNAASLLVTLVTSVVTIFAAFLYLAYLHAGMALVMCLVTGAIALVYRRRTETARASFDGARTSWNVYVKQINEALDGFKELALHSRKRREFRQASTKQCDRYRRAWDRARISLLDAFLFGEALLLAALGVATFLLPSVLGIDSRLRTEFIVVLLYLIAPVRAILGAVPTLVQARVAWRRIAALPVSEAEDSHDPLPVAPRTVESLELAGVSFQYTDGMRIGPISLSAGRGECVFITGGNGSGKTTLGKVMTGLYAAETGETRIGGRAVGRVEAGAHFAAVFSPSFTFDELYGVDHNEEALDSALARFGLVGKVERRRGWVDTVRLSFGQKKRLALVEACLQDRPILLFDEVAADQDPQFRRVFYEQFLDELRRERKIVIVISHDEQYFHVADRIVKLEMGAMVPPLAAPVFEPPRAARVAALQAQEN